MYVLQKIMYILGYLCTLNGYPQWVHRLLSKPFGIAGIGNQVGNVE